MFLKCSLLICVMGGKFSCLVWLFEMWHICDIQACFWDHWKRCSWKHVVRKLLDVSFQLLSSVFLFRVVFHSQYLMQSVWLIHYAVQISKAVTSFMTIVSAGAMCGKAYYGQITEPSAHPQSSSLALLRSCDGFPVLFRSHKCNHLRKITLSLFSSLKSIVCFLGNLELLVNGRCVLFFSRGFGSY